MLLELVKLNVCNHAQETNFTLLFWGLKNGLKEEIKGDDRNASTIFNDNKGQELLLW